ncbi:MAG: DsbA family protein [Gammaproteobacteria bacterium]
MKSKIRWYFDFVSPFAYLQLPYVLALHERQEVEFVPILFAGLLDAHGQRGPAEIPGKRTFTYQFVQWRAAQMGISICFPPAHPFNPLAALRLCVAADASPESVRLIFDLIWRAGEIPDMEHIAPVATKLGFNNPTSAIANPAVKDRLRKNFEQALTEGVFGVPTLATDGHLFWGEDSSRMFDDYQMNPALFDTPEMKRLSGLPVGVHRQAVR